MTLKENLYKLFSAWQDARSQSLRIKETQSIKYEQKLSRRSYTHIKKCSFVAKVGSKGRKL